MDELLIKIEHKAKLLSFKGFSNKNELLESYRKLKKQIISFNPLDPSFSQESLIEVIKELKVNAFSRYFKLNADPIFLEKILNTVNDFKVIERFLESSEIKYTKKEETILEERLNILISLFFLEQDLKKMENNEKDKNFFKKRVFNVYFEDLDQLKKIFTLTPITTKSIEFFFKSYLFTFISETSDCFNVALVDLYKFLLKKSEIKTKTDFIAHKNILVRKATEARKHQEFFNYIAFSEVLDTEKEYLDENQKKSGNYLKR